MMWEMKKAGRVLLCVFFSLVCLACSSREPYKIGFLGSLTGRLADFGVAGRNGVALAVERRNEAGGIAGRKIELFIEDDFQNPEKALLAFQKLRLRGAVAVVGPMTSTVATVLAKAANEAKLPLVSPLASTRELSGLDDYFLRVCPASDMEALSLAAYAHELGLKRIGILYNDNLDKAYTETFYRDFVRFFSYYPDSFVVSLAFSSLPIFSYSGAVGRILLEKPEGLFIVSEAEDTAAICQQLKKKKYDRPVFGVSGAMTEALFRNGGSSVEGLRFSALFDCESKKPEWLAFIRTYTERFGKRPEILAAFAYDAAEAVFQALEREPDPARLRSTLLAGTDFKGLQGPFFFDHFGDVQRERGICRIHDGLFQRVREKP